MDADLTPKELALQREGEELLRKVTGQQGQNIVGPDGAPLSPADAEVAAREAQLKAEGEAKEKARKAIDDHVAKLREKAAQERDESLKVIKEVCRENEVVKQCAQVMLHAHRLVAWAKLEMLQQDARVDDKGLMHLERQLHAAVYGGDFTSQSLLHDVRKEVCDFLNKRNQLYADTIRRRKAKIGKLVEKLPKTGFMLPPAFEKIRDQMGGCFGPGHVVIVYGPEPAIAKSLQLFANVHCSGDCSQVHYFSAEEKPKETTAAMVSASWWRNSLSSVCKFYETLDPVVESHSTMLLVEDFNLFLLAPETQMAVSERKQRILTALRQWAVEHAVIVVVGDPVAPEFIKARKYGGLPCAPVLLTEEGLLVGEKAIKGV